MSGVQWRAVLTGAPDSLPDLVLIMKNFSASLRGSTASFMSFTVDPSQLDDITARSNGDIVLYKKKIPDGAFTEVYRVNFNEYRSDRGARNWSVNISGRSTTAFPAGQTVALADVVYDGTLQDGRRQLQVNPFNDVIPGDTIDFDSVQTLIDGVSISSGDQTTMVITE